MILFHWISILCGGFFFFDWDLVLLGFVFLDYLVMTDVHLNSSVGINTVPWYAPVFCFVVLLLDYSCV